MTQLTVHIDYDFKGKNTSDLSSNATSGTAIGAPRFEPSETGCSKTSRRPGPEDVEAAAIQSVRGENRVEEIRSKERRGESVEDRP
jgi:hypothetical protein